MLEPGAYFKDWGVYGWIWALGWFGFVLGLLLVPESLMGRASPLVLSLPALGALLMVGSVRRALAA